MEEVLTVFPNNTTRRRSPLVQAQFLFGTDYLLLQHAKKVSILSYKDINFIEPLMGHTTNINNIHPIKDIKKIYTTTQDGILYRWNTATDFPITKLTLKDDSYFRLVANFISSDHFLTAKESIIYEWKVSNTNQPIAEYQDHEKYITALSYAVDSSFVISADKEQLHIWDSKSPSAAPIAQTKVKRRKKVDQVALHTASKNALFSYKNDNTLYYWNIDTGDLRELKGHQNSIKAISILKEGKQALTIASDSLAILWDVALGTPIKKYSHPESKLVDIFIVEKEGSFFTASPSFFYKWELSTGKYTQYPKLGKANIQQIAYQDKHLYLGTTEGVQLLQFTDDLSTTCLLYTSPSPRDQRGSRMPSSA